MSAALWIFLAIGLLLFFWAVGAYNRLVRLKYAIANAFGQIDVQLKRRYDLIPNLVEVARKYLAHEARKVKEKMDDEERRAIAEADALSLAADQADHADVSSASDAE